MLIRYSIDYAVEIDAALTMVGHIQNILAEKEPYMGNSVYLDELYMRSVLLHGIAEHLMYDDNAQPQENERLLFCLKSLLAKELCKPCKVSVVDKKIYHVPLPYNLEPIPYVQGSRTVTSGATTTYNT